MSKDKKETALALHVPFAFKTDYSFGTQVFMFDLVTVDSGNKVRNAPSDYGEWHEFNGLTFRCRASVGQSEDKPYGYSCEFRDVFSVDMQRAEEMVKILKRIAKAEASFPVRPQTFGQYVQLISKALGVTSAVQDSSKGSWHDETEHVWWLASEIQWLVDRRIDEFLAEHHGAMEMARSR